MTKDNKVDKVYKEKGKKGDTEEMDKEGKEENKRLIEEKGK